MNSLSWLLYAADAFNNARVVAGMAAAGLGVAALGSGIFAGILGIEGGGEAGAATKVFKTCVMWLLVPAFVIAVVPSRNTIMLIAASEVGETVLASPQAQSIGGEAGELATDSLRVLRKFINEQLETGDKP